MAKVNVYLPDSLEEAVRSARLPISAICQEALREALTMSEELKPVLEAEYAKGGIDAIVDYVLRLYGD